MRGVKAANRCSSNRNSPPLVFLLSRPYSFGHRRQDLSAITLKGQDRSWRPLVPLANETHGSRITQRMSWWGLGGRCSIRTHHSLEWRERGREQSYNVAAVLEAFPAAHLILILGTPIGADGCSVDACALVI